MAICPTCGKTFDERSFHVLASGQAFDTAECALLALEAADPAIGLAGLPAPAGLGPFARPGRSAMMRSMRARLPFGLLVAALAASAILSAYLWLRALGAGPTPPAPEPAAAAVPPSPAPQNSPPESQPASTPPSSEPSKPGWGCGDKNHSHSGPPGNGSGNGSPC